MLTSELIDQSGVIAAGEYSYRGDRFSYKGEINDDMARMAAIMCRATSMSEHMQTDMLDEFCPDCGAKPAQGWIVKGPQFTVCNVANVFAFLRNDQASINEVMSFLRTRLAGASSDLV